MNFHIQKGVLIMTTLEKAYNVLRHLNEEELNAFLVLFGKDIPDDEAADDAFCEELLQKYEQDDDPEKHDAISLEDFAEELGLNIA